MADKTGGRGVVWGRGRGRGRGQNQDRPQPGANVPPRGINVPQQIGRGQQPVGRGQQPGPPQREHAPGRVMQQPQPSTSGTRPVSQQPQQSAGRGLQCVGIGGGDIQGGEEGLVRQMSQLAVGAQSDGRSVGRGAMRGRRIIEAEILNTRPKDLVTKKGNTGSNVTLQANYFKLLTMADWCLYQYRVDVAPEEDRTIVRKRLLAVHREILQPYIFDGTVMYTIRHFIEPLELFSTRQSDGVQIRINIRLVGDIVKGDYHYLQFYNIMTRKCMENLRLQLVGRNYYDAASRIEVAEFRVDVWPGYLTSIRQHEYDVLMCTEIIHKVMRHETVLDILEGCLRNHGVENFKPAFSNQIIGAVVLTDYNNNTYRIDDVDYEVSPSSTFRLRTGDDISYRDYYRTKYQITIGRENQPMLVSRTKPRDRRAGQAEFIYLIPELCRTTGLTDDMRNNFRLMQALAGHTRVSPSNRIQRLLQFNSRLHATPDNEMTRWNMTLDTNLINVPGRVLPPETITFHQNMSCSAGEDANWTRDMQRMQMLRSVGLTNWILISSARDREHITILKNNLSRAASGMRFALAEPQIVTIRNDHSDTYAMEIENIMSKSAPQLIFCVVSNNRADRYSVIKKKCCVDRPVPTQVFLAKNIQKKNLLSIATKVVIQMNCKIGGAPWHVPIPSSDIMVVGFDVCHDTNTKGRDFGAMVASLDKNFTRYYSAVTPHTNGEEISTNLPTHMFNALRKYKQVNGTLPSRIIIYRDGVGEGQIPYVYEHEVENTKSMLAKVYGPDHPAKMTYIIVTKRINTRFFLSRNNPRPGTVVDDVVTNPIQYDFFIVSQHVREGTVTPTSYNVIYDNSGLNADRLQRLTFKLTHLYYNWSGTVRVPAPCQYAHKLAFLVAQSIHTMPNAALEDLLYFL